MWETMAAIVINNSHDLGWFIYSTPTNGYDLGMFYGIGFATLLVILQLIQKAGNMMEMMKNYVRRMEIVPLSIPLGVAAMRFH
jgi:hypothetical protein